MGVPFGTRTAWVDDVLRDVRGLVVTAGLVPKDLCYESLNEPDAALEEPTGDRFLAVYPGDVDTSVGVSDGALESWVHSVMTVAVDVNARITKDTRGRSFAVLSDGVRGFSNLTKSIAKKLHRANIANDAGDSYLFEPIRVSRVQFPRKARWSAWSRATILVNVQFRADFS